jgi:hypothetical protein
MPHWTTTARKIKEKMVGDRNRPLGLVLEWKMMMALIIDTFGTTLEHQKGVRNESLLASCMNNDLLTLTDWYLQPCLLTVSPGS